MIIPTGHRVLVKPDPIEEKTDAGIFIVQDERTAKGTQVYGTVEAVGPDAWKAFRKIDENGNEVNGQPWASKGDRVVFSRFAGRFISDPNKPDGDDNEFVILNDEDIVAIIREDV